jgi:hypothetical protein
VQQGIEEKAFVGYFNKSVYWSKDIHLCENAARGKANDVPANATSEGQDFGPYLLTS